MIRFVGHAALYLALWVILNGVDALGLAMGILTALAASAISLRLSPPLGWRPNVLALIRSALRFPGQSVMAGVDIGRRALASAMPLSPGFVEHRTRLPEGYARSLFRMIASLLPGSLPCGPDEGGVIQVHVLDTAGTTEADLAREEARFARAFGTRQTDD